MGKYKWSSKQLVYKLLRPGGLCPFLEDISMAIPAFQPGLPLLSFGTKEPGDTRQQQAKGPCVRKVVRTPLGDRRRGCGGRRPPCPLGCLSQTHEAGCGIPRGVVPGRVRHESTRAGRELSSLGVFKLRLGTPGDCGAVEEGCGGAQGLGFGPAAGGFPSAFKVGSHRHFV